MKRTLLIVPCALFALSALSGCTMMREHFGSKSDAYKKSAQGKPLEVPPGLDSPNRSGSLTIPEPSASVASEVTDGRAPAVDFQPSIAPPLEAANLAGDGMQVADGPDHTWTRVGLALERSGIATIVSRDAAQRTYEITATGTKSTSPSFLKKVVTLGMANDKRVKTPVGLRVRVTGVEGASKVTVEGATTAAGANAAREVLQTLRQRMS
ncbi:MAG TPA: hypothetical protein VFN25_11090 [Dokdonella sp.]|uniref:hypothetical protein n=1 Tax=Dokdonella sp. TaxID=2291710 RepID=UPI002D7FAC11|nr:hypothetical protein [Dokdonella sp.]HET9033437.1 hypothetical protein [Dokdonella sp.]